MTFTTRFAPSPTGPLHLGHAYSAWLAHSMAKTAGGRFLLRIEDIDRARARPEWEAQIYEDLHWLGLTWPTPVLRQSERAAAYDAALAHLDRLGVLYPCRCTRSDIRAALSAPQEGAPMIGPDGPVYPGTCRPEKPQLSNALQCDLPLRLNMAEAVRQYQAAQGDTPLTFAETGAGPDGQTGTIEIDPQTLVETVGDVVLSRRGMGTSYHLSVVVDDAAQKVSHVVRGADLFEATQIHVLLQTLLDLPRPVYHHHALVRDETGKRLAKRDDARAISLYRREGLTPEEVIALATPYAAKLK